MNKNQQPKVSVIIPTYNRAMVIDRAIDSVLNQTYKNIEIIVVDDGSTDNTKNMVTTNYGDKVKYIYQEQKGAPVARNKGVQIANGEYINFLDSDDYFLPVNIEEKVKTLNGDSSMGWVSSDSYYLEKETGRLLRNRSILQLKNTLVKKKQRLENWDEFFDLLLFNGIVNTNSAMLRKECVKEVHGFDETLPSFQDVNFFYRVAKKFRAKYIDTPLVVQVPQNISISSNRDRYYQGKMMLIEKTQKLFPEDAKRLGYPNGATVSDIHNYRGIAFLKQRQRKKAIKEFLKSIKVYPCQKMAYIGILKGFFNK